MIEQTRLDAERQTNLWQYAERHKPQVENSLRQFLPLAPANIETEFNEAVEYALFPGGKRLRPVLTLLGAELVGGSVEAVLPSAIAVEYIHTSSLIFDDLPCMDNAAKRRGKMALHERFNEGLAILVALSLLNASYGLVFVSQKTKRAIKAHAELVECVGASGMVGGQAIDLALAKGAGAGNPSAQDYNPESIRNLKTSALVRLALRIGAIPAGANNLQLNALSRFAELLGDAYQLTDDLIDLSEDSKIFKENQTTFAIAFGRKTAFLKLRKLITEAKGVLLDNFVPSQSRNNLIELTDYLADRKF